MRRTWGKLGGQLGLGCVALGLLLIGVAWNGAASIDFVSGQVPYLLSGGALGLALVGTGIGLLVVQGSRKDRAILESHLRDLTGAVERLANALGAATATNGSAAATGHAAAGLGPGMVVVGASSYHRPDCRLAEGKTLSAMPLQAAEAEGLTPCRICHPEAGAETDAVDMAEGESGRGRRARRRSTTSS
jgi:hypothetical protein